MLAFPVDASRTTCLNESPHPKVGKLGSVWLFALHLYCLNESPHPKVGKSFRGFRNGQKQDASMKVPTRRWGNDFLGSSELG